MKLFKNIFNKNDDEETIEKPQRDYGKDENGNKMYKEDFVNKVLTELERRRDERRGLELQWQLNANFLSGNQHCDINTYSDTVEEYDAPLEGMENEVFNQIEPLFKTRLANLDKISYAMTVHPRTSELDDIAKARVSTSLLKYKQAQSDFNGFKANVLNWAEITGTAGILTWWDTHKGDVVGTKVTAVLSENGVEEEKKEEIYNGDIAYGLLTPYEIFPETIYKQFVKDQRSIILEQAMSVDDIYDLYGVRVPPGSVQSYSMCPVEGAGGFGYVSTVSKMSYSEASNAERVITYFERKNRDFPQGRMAIIIGNNLYHYGDLPYDEIPLVIVKSDEVAGQFFGRSYIQSEIPLQRSYNGLMNSIHDYAKRIPIASPLVEEGSVDDWDEFCDAISQPGSPIKYKKGHNKPDFMQPASFPSQISNQLAKIKSDMEYTAGVSQLMVYGQQNGVTSGAALQTLSEIDNVRLSTTGENLRRGIKQLARIWLSIYKKCASGYRVLRISGLNSAGDALIWTTDDIDDYDITFDTENELVFSKEQQNRNYIQAYQLGVLADSDGRVSQQKKDLMLQALHVVDFGGVTTTFELQKQRADRENSLLRYGIPPVIEPVDNHSLHIEEHEKMMLQLEYQTLRKNSPELCKQFEQHIEQHKALLQQEQAQGMGGI